MTKERFKRRQESGWGETKDRPERKENVIGLIKGRRETRTNPLFCNKRRPLI